MSLRELSVLDVVRRNLGGENSATESCRPVPRPLSKDLGGFLLQELFANLGLHLNYFDTAWAAFGALAVAAQGLAFGVVVNDRETVRGAL